jgi:glycosyltransferase involved in cell wall biosynthesis
VPAERILALTFGIDLSRFPLRPPAARFPGGVVRLVCNRSLNAPVYDLPTVLRAVAEARRRGVDVRLSLPATGRLAPECRQLAAELGIAEIVAFGQGYRPEDVPDMMAAHDAYVSASHWDGASLSLMEAMACGGFPVVTDIAANREWVEHGKTALVFPPGDWQALASLVADLPRRADFIDRAVRLNLETVRAKADRSRNLRRLMDRLEGLAVSRAAGGDCPAGAPARGRPVRKDRA